MKPSIKMKPGNSEREKYWNQDYVAYWKARVEEANNNRTQASAVVAGDAKTSSDGLYSWAIDLLSITNADAVLELGCGFGRSLAKLCQAASHVAAVDISEKMIEVAKGACQEPNISFHVSPSEELPFPSEAFDVVVCFAAFDAMYQTEALIEMNRVCKTGARLLITGKNDNYHDDDVAALEAEIGARAKNHPNYFTDVKKLMRNLTVFGLRLETQKYYLRRGDFSKQVAHELMPEIFYEYLLILRKVAACDASGTLAISSEMSRTLSRRPIDRKK